MTFNSPMTVCAGGGRGVLLERSGRLGVRACVGWGRGAGRRSRPDCTGGQGMSVMSTRVFVSPCSFAP